jgi:hypothetical protein
MAHFHDDGKPCDGTVWKPEERCTAVRHRITTATHVPRQTREYLRSPWTWPLAAFELASRTEAWWRGVLHRNGRLPL